MSDQPLPPPPAWFAQQQEQHQSYPYPRTNASYGNHPPPPPPQAFGNVPPPLYGYNPGSHYSYSQSHNQQQSPDPKRCRLNHGTDSALYKCNACQVSLESQFALEAHTKAHITCTRCSFTASRKVVNAHFASAHGKFAGGGFKTVTIAVPGCRLQTFKICVGNHPDDVQKWIQERKRKFPRQNQSVDVKQSAAVETETKGNKKESALGSLLDGYGSSSSEDEHEEKSGAQQSVDAEPMNGEANGDKEECSAEVSTQSATKASTEASTRSSNYRTRPCRYFMRNGSCRNGDACSFSHDVQSQPQQQQERPTPRTRKPRQSSTSTTLLRKLLENDRRRESALSIQLLEYLVDCNYLQEQQNEK